MHLRHPLSVRLFLTLLPFTLLSSAARAQTRVVTVEGYPITIEFREGDQRVADRVAEITREALPRLTSELGMRHVGPFRIFLISDMKAFQKEQNIRLPYWGVAFALMDNQIMLVDVKRATNSWNGLEKVIPHELSHLLVAQKLDGVGMPVWFLEGLALWQAREWSLLESWRLMEAVWGNRAPGLVEIYATLPYDEPSARDAYRVAYAGFTERFADQMDLVPHFLDAVTEAGDFPAAFASFWNENEYQYYARFGRLLNRRYKSRLLFFQTGPLFTLVAVFFVFAIVILYVRNRRRLRRMEDIDHRLFPEDG